MGTIILLNTPFFQWKNGLLKKRHFKSFVKILLLYYYSGVCWNTIYGVKIHRNDNYRV